jgi:hypothetical protein
MAPPPPSKKKEKKTKNSPSGLQQLTHADPSEGDAMNVFGDISALRGISTPTYKTIACMYLSSRTGTNTFQQVLMQNHSIRRA